MNYSISDLVNGARTMAHSVFGKRDEYHPQFNHEEDGLWYVDFPNWPFDHHNLLMVAGADKHLALSRHPLRAGEVPEVYVYKEGDTRII